MRMQRRTKLERQACIIYYDSIRIFANLINASQKTFETLLDCKKICEGKLSCRAIQESSEIFEENRYLFVKNAI